MALVQSYQVSPRQWEQQGSRPERVFLQASQITGYEHHVNETIAVSEGINVVNGGELVIENSTVIFTKDGTALVAGKGGSLTIRTCHLYSFVSCSWWITGDKESHLQISGSELSGSGTSENAGINILTDDASVTNCIVTGFGGDSINIQNCRDTFIAGNTISSSSKEGINIERATNTRIVNNFISDTGFDGIYAFNTGNLLIRDNAIQSTTYEGIVFVNCSYCMVNKNSFRDSGIDGIGMQRCYKMTISNNTFLNCQSCGIGATFSTDFTISGNFISGIFYDGINIDKYCGRVVIERNAIKDAETGLYVGSSFNVSAVGNYVEKTTYNGIYANEESENIDLMCNSVFDSAVGIYVEDSSNVAVVGNLVNESAFCDVSIYFSDDVETYLNGFCSNIRSSADPVGSHVKWHNGTMGNFWCHYNGDDENNDGIGDKMHVVDDGNYDFFPLMSVQTVLDFMESFAFPAPFWETTEATTSGPTNATSLVSDEQVALYLMFNSIVQFAGISLVVVVILQRRKLQ
jgi:parallel beta-helix repeat protein